MWQLLQKHNGYEKRAACLRKEEKLILLLHPDSLKYSSLFY